MSDTPKRVVGTPFAAGNPGRPKGARQKLSTDFLKALSQSFEEKGPATIEAMRSTDPSGYCKIIASLLPKELTGEDGAPLFPNVTVHFGKSTDS